MPKPVIDGKQREWQRGDVVQVTDVNHYCFPALFIVRGLKSYGVKAYGFTWADGQAHPFYINFEDDDIELVGSAVLVEKSE